MKIALVSGKMQGGVKQVVDNSIKSLKEIGENYEFIFFTSEGLVNQNDSSLDIFEDYYYPNVTNKFLEFLEAEAPDIVHFHHLEYLGSALIGIADEAGFKTVVSTHDYWLICPRLFLLKSDLSYCNGPNIGINCAGCLFPASTKDPSLIRRSMARFDVNVRMLNEKADKIIAVSQSVKDKLNSQGVSPEKIEVVIPWIDKLDIALSEVNTGNIRIGYIGHIAPHKGVHVLVEAFTQTNREGELHLFGSIDNLYEATIKGLALGNPNIFFHGPYEHIQLSTILSNIDLLVIPSVCPETGPLVAQEALASKVPVVGSRIGGIPEFVTNDNGALFTAGNVTELSGILQDIMSNPSVLQEWKRMIPNLPKAQVFGRNMDRIYKELYVKEKRVWKVENSHTQLTRSTDRAYLRDPYIPGQLDAMVKYLKTKHFNSVVVFGAGKMGRTTIKYLSENNVRAAAILDNDSRRWGECYEGIPIKNPNSISFHDVHAIVVASEWEGEIVSQLGSTSLNIPVIGLLSFRDY